MTARRMESGCPSGCGGAVGCPDDWHLLATADNLYRRGIDLQADRAVARVGWAITIASWTVAAAVGGLLTLILFR